MHVPRNARLEIHLLGTFDAVLDGVPLGGFRSDKVRALLAYLTVEAGQPHRRDALATLLWGEYAEHAAQRTVRMPGELRLCRGRCQRCDSRVAGQPARLS